MKGKIYLCRMISTEVKKRCVIEKRIKHLNKGRNLKYSRYYFLNSELACSFKFV